MSDCTEIYITSADRTSGTHANAVYTLPGSGIRNCTAFEIRNVSIPLTYYNVSDTNNSLAITELYNDNPPAGSFSDTAPTGQGTSAFLQNWIVQPQYRIARPTKTDEIYEYMYDATPTVLTVTNANFAVAELALALQSAMNDSNITIVAGVNDKIYFRHTSAETRVGTLTPGDYRCNALLDETCRAMTNGRNLATGAAYAANLNYRYRWTCCRRSGLPTIKGGPSSGLPFFELVAFDSSGVKQTFDVLVSTEQVANVMTTLYSSIIGSTTTWISSTNYPDNSLPAFPTPPAGSYVRGCVFELVDGAQKLTTSWGKSRNGLVHAVSLDANTGKLTWRVQDSRVYTWSYPTISLNFAVANSLYKQLGFDYAATTYATVLNGARVVNFSREAVLYMKSRALCDMLRGDPSYSLMLNDTNDKLCALPLSSFLPFEVGFFMQPMSAPLALNPNRGLKYLDLRFEFTGNRPVDVEDISFTLVFYTDSASSGGYNS